MTKISIVTPTFNEEGNIEKTLNEILKTQKINFRILVVFDFYEDPTLSVIKKKIQRKQIICLKNKYNGFNGAVKTAFENLNANAIMLYPADDHENFD